MKPRNSSIFVASTTPSGSDKTQKMGKRCLVYQDVRIWQVCQGTRDNLLKYRRLSWRAQLRRQQNGAVPPSSLFR